MKKLKGIISFILSISVIFLMMPFNIYADTDITVQYNSSESEWSSKMSVTNYCDGTNTQASCKLTFTLNDNYYGYVMFNAYNNDTQIYTNQYVYVAAGIGEYNYLFYQNGVKPITKIYVSMTNLFLRGANIDLSEVVQLLTLINSSNQAIYSNSVTIRNNLISVLEEEIESNGYLDIISKTRAWNIPIESYSLVLGTLLYQSPKNFYDYGYNIQFPLFIPQANETICRLNLVANHSYDLIFISRASSVAGFNTNYSLATDNGGTGYTWEKFTHMETIFMPINGTNSYGYLAHAVINCNTFGNYNLKAINGGLPFIPIYFNDVTYNYNSTDFALQFGLSNKLLDNIQLIANGTNQSQSAASNLEQSNNQMSQDMNSLATIESGYNQQFNNSLQTIDFTNPVQSNQGMLPAANFVISVFNGLISNNPFSVLIIIVCILLIGKKVIGK